MEWNTISLPWRSCPDLTNSLHVKNQNRENSSDRRHTTNVPLVEIRKYHKHFVRFFWYKDNDPTLPLEEYRKCVYVHLLGNSPSPAVAACCIRQCVQVNKNCDSRVSEFVNRNIYVDGGLIFYPTEDKALIKILQKHNLHLKKKET